MDKVAPPWVNDKPVEYDIIEVKENRSNNNDMFGFNGPFRRAELDRALANCRDRLSPGTDNIEYKILKNLPDYMKNIVLAQYKKTSSVIL